MSVWRALSWSVTLGTLLQPLSLGAAGPQGCVTSSASRIRSFQLTADHLRKLESVGQTMARLPASAPDAPRPDAAMFTVLSMSLSFNEPFTDRTIADVVRTIETAHPELAAAIRTAGLTPSDYVLTQITLLLAWPVVAAERRSSRPETSSDISAANLAFVRTNWDVGDRAMHALTDAVAQYAR